MRNLIALILCLLLIILVVTLVLRSVDRKPTGEAGRVPVFYTYTIIAGEDKIGYGYLITDSTWVHTMTWKGDTLQFCSTEKHLLSESRNLVNAVTGEIEHENVALVREVIRYE